MSDNPSFVPVHRPQYNSPQVSQVSVVVVDACHSGGPDHELGSNEHVLGFSSAGPYGHYPATSANHANAFPPARYSGTMPVGYDDPPHLATVGVHLQIGR